MVVVTCAASSGESAAEEDDSYDNDDAAQPLEPTTVPVSEAAPDAQGHDTQLSTSNRLKNHENAGAGGHQQNTKDLKATGVARAAARLLEQDTADGGLAILSVRYQTFRGSNMWCTRFLLVQPNTLVIMLCTQHPDASDQQ